MGLRGRGNLTDEHIFFVTTTTVGFTKVFVKEVYCDILIKNIKHYQNKYKFEILAYVDIKNKKENCGCIIRQG